MTLDEAIEHCENVAAKCFAERSARNHSGKCGFEHLELAEWLRELKTYKEQEPCEDAREAIKTLKENLCDVCAYGAQNMESCDIRSCDNRDAIKALEQEPCEDAISREDAMFMILHYGNEIRHEVMDDIKASMIKLPSVTHARPKGHWIREFDDIEGEVRFICSNCRKHQLFASDFCYHCGSDNRKEEE